MPRRDILKIIEEILKLLLDKKEHSVQNISTKLKCQWKTTIKCLNFLRKINLVKERKGKVTHKAERLFSFRKY